LKQDWLLTFTPPAQNENETIHKKKYGDRANNTIKLEALIEANLEVMYALVLSVCDPVLKDQVFHSEEYDEINIKQDGLGPLRCIEKIMFSNREDDTHMGYNHMIAITKYY